MPADVRPDSWPAAHSGGVPDLPLPGGYKVTGGVGGISFGLDELRRAASLLLAVSADASALHGSAGALRAELEWIAFRPGGCYPAEAAEDLRAAGCSIAADADELQATASLLRLAADQYDAMEAASLAAVHAAASARAWFGGFLLRAALLSGGLPAAVPAAAGQLAASERRADAEGLRNVLEETLATAPEYAGALAGLPPGVAGLLLQDRSRGGLQARPLALRLALWSRGFADAVQLFRPGTLRVERLDPGPGGGQLQPGSIDSMFAGVADAYGRAGSGCDPVSVVEIRTVDRGDGTRAVVVDLPGTEVWNPPDSANLFDLESDLEGMTSPAAASAGKTAMVQELVRRALRDAHIGARDAVILNGHSGGGIHALALASDPAFLAEFNLRMVNVAGAPGGYFPVGQGVKVLALENVDDPVTALDAMPNPDRKDFVTVTSPRRSGAPVVSLAGRVAAAHSFDAYREDARLLDRSTNLSVLAHRAELAALLGPSAAAGTAAVQRFVYRGTDVNDAPLPPARSGAAPTRSAAVPPPTRTAAAPRGPRRARPDEPR